MHLIASVSCSLLPSFNRWVPLLDACYELYGKAHEGCQRRIYAAFGVVDH